MKNFTVNNPVILHFGNDILNKLPEALNEYGKKILLIYGKGSVKKYGYYDKITSILKKSNFEITEYEGIKPNPVVEDVEKAVKKGIEKKVDSILALGGGSVIDTAKAVALCIPENLNPWDVITYKTEPKKSLPLVTILTLAATGTEMNAFSVIQNDKTKEKLGFGYPPLSYPKHSFLNPEFTFTVPKNYTAYGIVDITAHALENYFGDGESPLADRFAASIIKETIRYAPLVLEEPENYEYRANILLQSNCALNGITTYGKTGGDWGVHSIGHILSLLYDMPHGASLSVAYPAWFKLMKNRIPEKIKKISSLIFDTEDIDKFIGKIKDFFISIDCPVNLQSAGVEISEKEKIVNLMKKNKVSGYKYKLSDEDTENIVDLMYE